MGSDEPTNRGPHRVYAAILTSLLLLFCFRVGAQLLQFWFPVGFLPPFDSWESGALPYGLLCLSQAIIILVCTRVIWRLYGGRIIPSPRIGGVLLVIGWFYFGLMGIRLIVGLTIAPDHYWFSARLPTVFHMVLASFILVYGRFHLAAGRTIGSHRLGDAA
ncbi:MAG: hypothetical protein OEV17_11080 [Nitrospira sp.]|nr:hypothetical protein [Nitrospira sp.]